MVSDAHTNGHTPGRRVLATVHKKCAQFKKIIDFVHRERVLAEPAAARKNVCETSSAQFQSDSLWAIKGAAIMAAISIHSFD